jgi:transposase
MWTREIRGRMAELARKTKRYQFDLTDTGWERIELPRAARRSHQPSMDLREVLNAMRWLARSAGGWRRLPVHFGPGQAVYWWFRRFVRRLLFRTIHDVALMSDREAAGREASPTGGVLDSQTVKVPFAELPAKGRPPLISRTVTEISRSSVM